MNKRSNSGARWQNPHRSTHTAATRLASALLLGDALRTRVSRGVAIGTFCIELPTPNTIAALALAGFDFVVLDMEHSATDYGLLEPLLLAAHACGLPALVRPCSDSIDVIGKVLDMGAHGIMAAHVETAEHARAIVAQTRFPPRGQRSFSPLSRFDALPQPLRQLDRATYLVLQIEGRKALQEIERIAAVPGVDALFVGPYDLSLSLGVTPTSPKVTAAAKRVAASTPASVGLGVYIDDSAQCGAWATRGYRLQCVSFDGRMFANSARTVLSAARKSMSTSRRSSGSRK